MSMCGVAVVGGVLVGYILTTRGREHLGCMRGRWRVLFNRHLLRIWAFCPRFVEMGYVNLRSKSSVNTSVDVADHHLRNLR